MMMDESGGVHHGGGGGSTSESLWRRTNSSSSSSNRILAWIETVLTVRLILFAMRLLLLLLLQPAENGSGQIKSRISLALNLVDILTTLGLTLKVAVQVAQTLPWYWKLQHFWRRACCIGAVSRNIGSEVQICIGNYNGNWNRSGTSSASLPLSFLPLSHGENSNLGFHGGLFWWCFTSSLTAAPAHDEPTETLELAVLDSRILNPTAVPSVSRMERGTDATEAGLLPMRTLESEPLDCDRNNHTSKKSGIEADKRR